MKPHRHGFIERERMQRTILHSKATTVLPIARQRCNASASLLVEFDVKECLHEILKACYALQLVDNAFHRHCQLREAIFFKELDETDPALIERDEKW